MENWLRHLKPAIDHKQPGLSLALVSTIFPVNTLVLHIRDAELQWDNLSKFDVQTDA